MTEDLNKGLLPCPFCGGEAILQTEEDHHGGFHSLGCKTLNCAGVLTFYSVESAEFPVAGTIRTWNTRAVTAREEKLIAALKNAHDELEYDYGNGVMVKDDIAQALKELGITEERKDG